MTTIPPDNPQSFSAQPDDGDIDRTFKPAAQGEQTHAFSFTGNANDYFRIWVVNLFLTLISLGLWSAWAKVRKRRYFYGNTWIAGANFEYHANPWAIFRGRLIIGLIAILYWYFDLFNPIVAQVVLMALFLLLPWFVARSMQFNAANTSWRNLRFRFSGNSLLAAKCVWPLIAFHFLALMAYFFANDLSLDGEKLKPKDIGFIGVSIALSFFYPYLIGSLKRYSINYLHLGGSALRCFATIGQFYKIFFKTSLFYTLLIFGAIVVFSMLTGIMAAIGTAVFGGGEFAKVFAQFSIAAIGFMFVMIAFGVAVQSMLIAFLRTRLINNTVNQSEISLPNQAPAHFLSNLTTSGMWPLLMSNSLAILFTCGLAIPWAQIRYARYRIAQMALVSEGDFESMVVVAAQNNAAASEAMGEYLGMDLSL
jgi:uncharacterized membrane protein YjgN (DUF898 family)